MKAPELTGFRGIESCRVREARQIERSYSVSDPRLHCSSWWRLRACERHRGTRRLVHKYRWRRLQGKTMTIDIVYFEGCPNIDAARPNSHRVEG
jgi:hypothetical protein